jgi:hypothetical protein
MAEPGGQKETRASQKKTLLLVTGGEMPYRGIGILASIGNCAVVVDMHRRQTAWYQ